MFADLRFLLLSLLLLDILPELLLQCPFLLLLALDQLLLLLHNLLEAAEIFIYLRNPFFAPFGPLVLIRDGVVKVLYPQLYLQSVFFFLFSEPAPDDICVDLVHLLTGDLPYSIFEHFPIELLVVDLAEEISIIRGEIPEGSLLNIFGNLAHHFFVAGWVCILREHLV